MRVIVIDEASMISAELLGTFENNVRKVVRSNGTYKWQAATDTTEKVERVFGGINVVMCADFWQLKPVAGTYLCSNPLEHVGTAKDALDIFWGSGPNSIRHFWDLTEVMRCRDPWYNEFLLACRFGRLTKDMYAFFHGQATLCAANIQCACNDDVVQIPGVGPCKKSWRDAFMKGCTDMRTLIANTECEQCHKAREARFRVGKNATKPTTQEDRIAYSKAIALFNFNVPRYFTMLLRARLFAKTHRTQIAWTYALDTPQHPSDLELSEDRLEFKRKQWLGRHDQDTANLTSLLPLAVGMPVRLTDTLDRNLLLYRHRPGKIHAWTNDPRCIPVSHENDVLLDYPPVVIYVQFFNATWTIGDLPQGVYPIAPKTRVWKVNKHSGISAQRKGFCLVPDFAATAHMIQGCTLDAAIAELESAAKPASLGLQVAAYVSLSRVRLLKRIHIIQPFSPFLFNRGPPAGPDRLIRKLAGAITAWDAMREWQEAADSSDDDGDANTARDPLKAHHLCVSCALQGKPQTRLPAKAFGVVRSQDFFPKYLEQGSWTRCLQCQAEANALWQSKEAAPVHIHEAVCETCETCRNHFLRVDVPQGHHVCAACKTVFAESHWSANSIRNHKYTAAQCKLVCKGCAANGFSARNLNKMSCSKCLRVLGHKKFDEKQIHNAIARDTLNTLSCLDCRDLLHCSGCNVGFKLSYWNKDEVKNYQSRSDRKTHLVCKTCKAQGKRCWDVTLYSCSACKMQFGCAKFDHADIKYYHIPRAKKKLTCQLCSKHNNDRIKVLHARLQKSKMVCKCFCPIHRHKCPMSLIYYGEKRWPGADGAISLDDYRFLESLTPTPKWWDRAWGRPTN